MALNKEWQLWPACLNLDWSQLEFFFFFFVCPQGLSAMLFSVSGVKVIIDSKAQLTLLGTEMDYVENKLSAEFIFNNPNIKGTCGCGESFSV